MSAKDDFDEKLIVIIEKVISDSFGSSGVLFFSWLRIHSVAPKDIPEKLDAFATVLETFSSQGVILQKIILKNLYSSFGHQFREIKKRPNFKECVIKLKNSVKC